MISSNISIFDILDVVTQKCCPHIIQRLNYFISNLVSGTLPFNGDTLMQLRENVVKCQYRVPWFLSQEIQQLLKGLLVIEPEKRISIDAIGMILYFIFLVTIPF